MPSHLRPLRPLRRALASALLAGTALLLSACGSTGGADASGAGTVRVVASTNVYGDIASSIGGDRVEVTSILSDPDQDPHSFEADPRTALAVSRADLLVENGGGYDDYMQRLRSASDSEAPVIDVVRLSGKTAPAGGELNEHVWYDLPTVARFARTLAARLSDLDPAHAADFSARAQRFTARIDALRGRERAVRRTDAGDAIGITEPVPLYLTEACGLVNRTPAAFSEAIEEGDDVAAPVLARTLDLYRDRSVRALVYNEQTSGPITQRVEQAAREAGIAVVPVTETLPRGESYLAWMGGTIDAVRSAVSG